MSTKIKKLLQYGILIVALIISWSLIRSITKIAGSANKISDEEVKVRQLQKENNDLQKQLANIKSFQFVEQKARDTLGLAKKGEIVAVLPDENALKALAPKFDQKSYTLPDPNWKLWMKLFL